METTEEKLAKAQERIEELEMERQKDQLKREELEKELQKDQFKRLNLPPTRINDLKPSNTTRKNHKPHTPELVDFPVDAASEGVDWRNAWGTVNQHAYLTRESDVTPIVRAMLNSIFQKYEPDLDCRAESPVVYGNVDIGICNESGIIASCCEVKRPVESVPKVDWTFDANVYGQVFDYLKGLAALTNMVRVYGIVTDLLHWKVMWVEFDQAAISSPSFDLPSKSTLHTPETSARSSSGGVSSPPCSPFDMAIAQLFLDGCHEIKNVGEKLPSKHRVESEARFKCFVSKKTWLYSDSHALWSMLKKFSNIVSMSSPALFDVQSLMEPIEHRLVISLTASKERTAWPYKTSIVNIMLDFDVMAHAREKCFYLWGHLGEGGSGRVVLASDTYGRVCTIKLYDGRKKEIEEVMNEAEEECHLFKTAYEGMKWGDYFRAVQFGSHVGLVMPHFCAIPKMDRGGLLHEVEETLRKCFLEKGLKYNDIKWHHIMRFREGARVRIVVVDMGQCERSNSNDSDWIQEQIEMLNKRVPQRIAGRKLDLMSH